MGVNLRDLTLKDLLGNRVSTKSFDYDLKFSLEKPGDLVTIRHRGEERFTVLGLKEARRVYSWLGRYITGMEEKREERKRRNGGQRVQRTPTESPMATDSIST